MQDNPFLTRVGLGAWPIVIAVICIPLVAPAAESRFFPIRTDQRMENITRSADRLCWEWVSIKQRNRVSDDLNVWIDTPGELGALSSVFERDTGMPWVRSRAVGVGPHRQPYCTLLPPYLKPEDPVRVRQTAFYPGLLPLWHVQVRFPDVISPVGSERSMPAM